jgi:hypothetical protein
VDEPAIPEVANDRPPQFEDLRFAVVLAEFVEELVVDVLVVDHEPLGVVERRLLRVAEVGIGPAADFRDGLLFEGLPFP